MLSPMKVNIISVTCDTILCISKKEPWINGRAADGLAEQTTVRSIPGPTIVEGGS
jgi:hypothetical protein